MAVDDHDLKMLALSAYLEALRKSKRLTYKQVEERIDDPVIGRRNISHLALVMRGRTLPARAYLDMIVRALTTDDEWPEAHRESRRLLAEIESAWPALGIKDSTEPLGHLKMQVLDLAHNTSVERELLIAIQNLMVETNRRAKRSQWAFFALGTLMSIPIGVGINLLTG